MNDIGWYKSKCCKLQCIKRCISIFNYIGTTATSPNASTTKHEKHRQNQKQNTQSTLKADWWLQHRRIYVITKLNNKSNAHNEHTGMALTVNIVFPLLRQVTIFREFYGAITLSSTGGANARRADFSGRYQPAVCHSLARISPTQTQNTWICTY